MITLQVSIPDATSLRVFLNTIHEMPGIRVEQSEYNKVKELRRWTDAERERCKAMHSQGATLQAMATALNRTPAAVNIWLSKTRKNGGLVKLPTGDISCQPYARPLETSLEHQEGIA